MISSNTPNGENRFAIGFTILSHGAPDQLQRLVTALDREYGKPRIVCHHDFTQTPLDISLFGDNVQFVVPHFSTGWGRFSVVQAQLAALRLLYAGADAPQWFINLSASDYPVMPGKTVKRLLQNTLFDAFVDSRPIDRTSKPRARLAGLPNEKLCHFDSNDNRLIKSRFYNSWELWIPLLRRRPNWRLGRYTFRLRARRSIYRGMPAYYGDHWFVGNANVARILLNPTSQHIALQSYLRFRTQVDETYYQTVLVNEPSLLICLNNLRFAEWNGGGAHPMILGEDQVVEALKSEALFARKFNDDVSVL
ncbi:MAG: hypothetical protein EOO61_17830, partial [Hymenobacter sp.]